MPLDGAFALAQVDDLRTGRRELELDVPPALDELST
jgi:hypothetical protein